MGFRKAEHTWNKKAEHSCPGDRTVGMYVGIYIGCRRSQDSDPWENGTEGILEEVEY